MDRISPQLFTFEKFRSHLDLGMSRLQNAGAGPDDAAAELLAFCAQVRLLCSGPEITLAALGKIMGEIEAMFPEAWANVVANTEFPAPEGSA